MIFSRAIPAPVIPASARWQKIWSVGLCRIGNFSQILDRLIIGSRFDARDDSAGRWVDNQGSLGHYVVNKNALPSGLPETIARCPNRRRAQIYRPNTPWKHT